MSHQHFFPLPRIQDLYDSFVGKTLYEVPLPSAVLDVAKIKHNCKLMLDAVSELNVSFRAHVKTHKTTELTSLQVGEDSKDVRLIVSQVIEAESLIPLLQDYQRKGAKVNVLYGIPIGRSKVTRLANVAKQLGPKTVSAMIDHVEQLENVKQFKREVGTPMCVFIKVDSGYHRAGLPPQSDTMTELVKAVSKAEAEGDLHLLGFYSHNSLSYGGSSPEDAMTMLKVEIEACQQAAVHLTSTSPRAEPLVISVGDSPAALSIQNLLPFSSSSSSSSSPQTTKLKPDLHKLLNLGPKTTTLEIHAGVYPVMDLQQISANPRATLPSSTLAAHKTQALTILAEVISTYPTRTSSPEALISAGTLALAREPCKSYPGFGVLTSWGLRDGKYTEEDSVSAERRMIVKRISQDHGVVGWENDDGRGREKETLPLSIGDRVRIWPNHACIAGVGFGWYLVVDSDAEDGGEVVRDVWVRWRGW